MSIKPFDVDQHEKEILEDFEKGEFVSVDNLAEEMRLARDAASNFIQRDKRVNVRLSGTDLNMVRRLAIQEWHTLPNIIGKHNPQVCNRTVSG